MRTTLTLDDQLLEEAQKLSGMMERPKLIHEALCVFVAREKTRRLMALAGTEPELKSIPRRRS